MECGNAIGPGTGWDDNNYVLTSRYFVEVAAFTYLLQEFMPGMADSVGLGARQRTPCHCMYMYNEIKEVKESNAVCFVLQDQGVSEADAM